jgi:hypothetical protein
VLLQTNILVANIIDSNVSDRIIPFSTHLLNEFDCWMPSFLKPSFHRFSRHMKFRHFDVCLLKRNLLYTCSRFVFLLIWLALLCSYTSRVFVWKSKHQYPIHSEQITVHIVFFVVCFSSTHDHLNSSCNYSLVRTCLCLFLTVRICWDSRCNTLKPTRNQSTQA